MFEALGRVGITVEKRSVLDAHKPIPGWLGQGFVSQHQYDLVFATRVLERSIDPRTFLQDVRLMMFSGALLYLEVPSLEHGSSVFQEGDDINPYHLWHFSVTGLAALLWSSGFYAIKVESDPSVPGWPCTRVLAVTRSSSSSLSCRTSAPARRRGVTSKKQLTAPTVRPWASARGIAV